MWNVVFITADEFQDVKMLQDASSRMDVKEVVTGPQEFAGG